MLSRFFLVLAPVYTLYSKNENYSLRLFFFIFFVFGVCSLTSDGMHVYNKRQKNEPDIWLFS